MLKQKRLLYRRLLHHLFLKKLLLIIELLHFQDRLLIQFLLQSLHRHLQFEVNRSTINTAMEELKANGLLETRVGAGTFIAENPWPHLLAHPKWQQHINASIHKPNIETIQLINDYEQRQDIIRLGTGER